MKNGDYFCLNAKFMRKASLDDWRIAFLGHNIHAGNTRWVSTRIIFSLERPPEPHIAHHATNVIHLLVSSFVRYVLSTYDYVGIIARPTALNNNNNCPS